LCTFEKLSGNLNFVFTPTSKRFVAARYARVTTVATVTTVTAVTAVTTGDRGDW
jgi:hypothetical protein